MVHTVYLVPERDLLVSGWRQTPSSAGGLLWTHQDYTCERCAITPGQKCLYRHPRLCEDGGMKLSRCIPCGKKGKCTAPFNKGAQRRMYLCVDASEDPTAEQNVGGAGNSGRNSGLGAQERDKEEEEVEEEAEEEDEEGVEEGDPRDEETAHGEVRRGKNARLKGRQQLQLPEDLTIDHYGRGPRRGPRLALGAHNPARWRPPPRPIVTRQTQRPTASPIQEADVRMATANSKRKSRRTGKRHPDETGVDSQCGSGEPSREMGREAQSFHDSSVPSRAASTRDGGEATSQLGEADDHWDPDGEGRSGSGDEEEIEYGRNGGYTEDYHMDTMSEIDLAMDYRRPATPSLLFNSNFEIGLDFSPLRYNTNEADVSTQSTTSPSLSPTSHTSAYPRSVYREVLGPASSPSVEASPARSPPSQSGTSVMTAQPQVSHHIRDTASDRPGTHRRTSTSYHISDLSPLDRNSLVEEHWGARKKPRSDMTPPHSALRLAIKTGNFWREAAENGRAELAEASSYIAKLESEIRRLGGSLR